MEAIFFTSTKLVPPSLFVDTCATDVDYSLQKI